MKNLYNYTMSDLSDLMVALGQKAYRGTQLYSWLYQKRVTSIDDMSDVSLGFRQTLKVEFELELPSIIKRQNSVDGTIKLLLQLEDKMSIEAVLMRYDYGNVVCVSSQVGCNMGCKFCASGLIKKQRDLKAHEMVSQVMVIQNILDKEFVGQRVSHVVVMGSGEPFDNYDNVLDFVKIINEQKGLAIGARHITVSTCGIPEKIKKYGDEDLQINLAISLHASDDKTRSEIMPINKAYPLKELFKSINEYEQKGGRRVTIEYILLKDVNDSLENAAELVELLKNTFAYVNLIPYNEVSENYFKRSSKDNVRKFYEELKKRKINVTIRKEFGQDIDAACGQLRAKKEGVINE